jgi:hypothetical protein
MSIEPPTGEPAEDAAALEALLRALERASAVLAAVDVGSTPPEAERAPWS